MSNFDNKPKIISNNKFYLFRCSFTITFPIDRDKRERLTKHLNCVSNKAIEL